MLQDIFLLIFVSLVATTIGGIVTREIFFNKNQRTHTGLTLGAGAGALWFILLLGGFISVDVTDAFSTTDPEVFTGLTTLTLIVVMGVAYLQVPQREPDPYQVQIPFYRDVDVLRVLSQAYFGILFIGSIVLLWVSLTENLADANFALDFNVYERRFGATLPKEGLAFNTEWSWVGADIFNYPVAVIAWIAVWLLITYLTYRNLKDQSKRLAMGVGVVMLALTVVQPFILNELNELAAPYLTASTNTRAILMGISNTIRVVVLSIIASTLLGILVGVSMLSNNYLLRNVANAYTEVFRNTPLLLQLIFIHFAFLQNILPQRGRGEVVTDIVSPASIGPLEVPNVFYSLSVQGLLVPNVTTTDRFIFLGIAILLAMVVGYFLRRWRIQVQDQTGQPAYTWRYVLGAAVVIIAIGWLIAGTPLSVDFPERIQRGLFFEWQGGLEITIAFVSTFLGLTLYTAAFIADIVRAGIQAVPPGQIEAARSLGHTQPQVLSLVVLPQALRLIIPPLGNQYVNLGKNSTLGFALGFGEAYQAVQLANNESGQAVPFFIGLMILYLLLSLTLSLFTNLMNSATRLKTR
jgi:general L-amino acid transport system permease protein